MRVTEYAAEAILSVMKNKNLDPSSCFMGVKQLDNGSLGIGFTKDREGRVLNFGDLRVTIADNINTDGVVVDFGKVDDKVGLVFISEEQYEINQKEQI